MAKESNSMDIDALIDKVSKLPIPDSEKADLLRKFKENMMNPERGEIENLNRIQSKYSKMQPSSSYSSIPGTSTDFLPSINPSYSGMPISAPSHPTQLMMSPMQPLQPLQPLQQQQGLTTAHFEVLKNKMDSIQLELVDLLRHVKDYTQRYMNATRQQDMEKIDAYINGLFEVDKQLKRAEEQAAAMSAVEDAEAAAAEPEKSTLTRATDGIKNFLGGIGDGVSGITSFVSSTANIVNDTLSKKVLSSATSDTTTAANKATSSNTTTAPATAPATAPKTNTANNSAGTIPAASTTISTTNTNSKNTNLSSRTASTNTRGNIVSVDEYIQSNMNQINNASPMPAALPIDTSANANNITSSNNINAMAAAPKLKIKQEETTTKDETSEDNQEEITNAIKKLNDTMNADIENTVSQSQSGGGSTSKQEKHLTRKIRMLRLRLTKRQLEAQLLDNDSKTKYNSKIIKNKNNKINKKTKKHN
jgi:hypothetical protein